MFVFRFLPFLLLINEFCCAQNDKIDTFYCHVQPIVYIKKDTTVNGVLINHPKGEFIFFLKEDSVERFIKNEESLTSLNRIDNLTNYKNQKWEWHVTRYKWDSNTDTLQAGNISSYLEDHSIDYQHEIRLKYILDRMGMSPAKDDICLIYIQDDFSPRTDRVQKSGANGYIFNKKDAGGYELKVYHGVSNDIAGLKPTGNEIYKCTDKQARKLTQLLDYITFPDSVNILTQRIERMTIVVVHNKAYFVPYDYQPDSNVFIENIAGLKWEFELLAKRLQKKTK